MKKIKIIVIMSVLIHGQISAQTNKKTFLPGDKVTVEKVSYLNRYGITIAADMCLPKNIDT
jgi:hypothetical protein